ncbi:MAG: EI24 domain-containing protein [Candidatus Brocadiae bacterium]|nr:EI24 domain-containing protein [Candidatus Brocadiia bacterium]
MNYFIGLFYYVKGIFFFITHPKLWLCASFPALVAFLGYSQIIKLGEWAYSQCKVYAAQQKASWFFEVFGFFVDTILVVLLGLAGIFLFIIVNFLSTPLQRWLSKETEKQWGEQEVYASNVGNFFSRFFSGIWNQLHAAFDVVMVFFLVLLVGFIPVIGQIFGILVASYYTAYTYLNLTLDRKGFYYKQKKEILKKNRGKVIGFGMACLLFLFAPYFFSGIWNGIFSILTVPLQVVGATLLCLEKIDMKSLKSS